MKSIVIRLLVSSLPVFALAESFEQDESPVSLHVE